MLALMLLWLAQEAPRQEGVSMRFYFLGEPIEELCDLVAGQTPNISRIEPHLDFDTDQGRGIAGLEYTFLTVVDGWIEIPAPGKWSFRLTSDDGSKLWIGDDLVVDNDGLHGTVEKRGGIALARGRHALRLDWINKSGGAELDLRMAPLGQPPAPLAPAQLSHTP